MLCPNCSTQLAMTDRQGIEIDFCPTCRGVWLDRGELDKIIERSSPSPQRPAADWDHGNRHSHHPKRKRRKSFLEELFD